MSAVPLPDPEQLGRFVGEMFAYADEGTFVSLRAFHERDKHKPPVLIRAVAINGAGLDPLVKAAVAAAGMAARHPEPAVFCPPVATFANPKHAGEADLANGVALSVELDVRAGEALAKLAGLLGRPRFVVASGGTWTDPATGEVQPKLHVHYRLNEPTRSAEEHALLKRARRLATKLIGGDATNIPAVHPIRWPGSVHRKGEPTLCRIVEHDDVPDLDLRDALDRLEEAAVAAGIGQRSEEAPGDGTTGPDTAELIRQLQSGEAMHDPLVRLAARYVGAGMAERQAIDTLQGLMEAVPPEKRGEAGRWEGHYRDIPRTVRTAALKYGAKAKAGDQGGENPDAEADAKAERQRRAAVDTDDDTLANKVLELVPLKRLDYERRRHAVAEQLGIRVSVLDTLVKAARQATGEEQQRLAQRDELVAIGLEAVELWKDEAEECFASVRVGDHVEHHRLRSTGYRRLLARCYGDRHPVEMGDGTTRPAAPGAQAMTEAIAGIEAQADRGKVHSPALRLAGDHSTVWLDLGGPDWSAAEITAEDWRIVREAPVKLVRAPGMLPLPTPVRGGDGLARLRQLLALPEPVETLVLGFLIGCFNPLGAYPVLAISGEQSSGKSTLTRIIRRLVDPNRAEARSAPRDERDLLIAARNGRLICIDNLSSLEPALSDAMCRVATGAGFSTRKLYSDDEEVLIAVRRPQILNAIPDVARAPDLLDRAMLVKLEARESSRYEAELWQEFEAALPAILGDLLDAIRAALYSVAKTSLATMPRMADFARWVEAAAPALDWKPGRFLDAYLANRLEAASIVLESDPVGLAIRDFVAKGRWPIKDREPDTIGCADLLALLNGRVSDETRRAKGWPKTPAHLSGRLRRVAPALRRVGIVLTIERDEHGAKVCARTNEKQKGGERQERQERQENGSERPFADAADAPDAAGVFVPNGAGECVGGMERQGPGSRRVRL